MVAKVWTLKKKARRNPGSEETCAVSTMLLGPQSRNAQANRAFSARYSVPTIKKNLVHDMVSIAWYGLSEVQKLNPWRLTLKLPSRFSKRWRLSRETTEPNPRSRSSSSVRARGSVVALIQILYLDSER